MQAAPRNANVIRPLHNPQHHHHHQQQHARTSMPCKASPCDIPSQYVLPKGGRFVQQWQEQEDAALAKVFVCVCTNT
jgi:hypothetical protein